MEIRQIYKCPICGNIVELLKVGGGELVCCGQPMLLETVKKEEDGNEKHLPVVTVNGNEISVKIGSVPHPMLEEHFIQWIECIVGNNVYKKELKPNEVAEAIFMVEGDTKDMIVREYCNIHGLWQA